VTSCVKRSLRRLERAVLGSTSHCRSPAGRRARSRRSSAIAATRTQLRRRRAPGLDDLSEAHRPICLLVIAQSRRLGACASAG